MVARLKSHTVLLQNKNSPKKIKLKSQKRRKVNEQGQEIVDEGEGNGQAGPDNAGPDSAGQDAAGQDAAGQDDDDSYRRRRRGGEDSDDNYDANDLAVNAADGQ